VDAAPSKEKHRKRPDIEKPPEIRGFLSVGATGIEPVTSAVSRQRSPAELSALVVAGIVSPEATSGIEPEYRVLQTLA
jgi:hypothetical protein